MLDLAVTIAFCVMAVRIAKAIRQNAAIFREFNQPRTLAFLVFLFPLGPFILLFGIRYLPFLLVPIAAAGCYLPALLAARKPIQVFERAGTDRVNRALRASREAFGIAVGGLIYVAIVSLIAIVIGTYIAVQS